MNTIEINTITKHAGGVCPLQVAGECRREHYVVTFLFDPSRHDVISTCLSCDKFGFIPLGPQPAINFFSRRQRSIS